MKRRRRQSKEPSVIGKFTLLNWQSDSSLIEWAQAEPRFKLLLAVITSERLRVMSHKSQSTTENFRLGLHEGYELALDVLHQLAQGVSPEPAVPEQTYEGDGTEGRVLGL